MVFEGKPGLAPLVDAGKVRIIGLASKEPSEVFPQLEPIATNLPGFNAVALFGIMASAGTPDDIIRRLDNEINRVLSDTQIKEQLIKFGFQPRAISSHSTNGIAS